MGLRDRAELSASSNGSTYRQAGPLDLKTQAGHAMQTPNDYDSNLPSSNPAPPLQNHMFSLDKRGFGDDSGDSLARLTEMFVGSKAAQDDDFSRGSTCRHGHAWIGTESQRNWPEMRKTLGKPGFTSGEDRNRTF
jgi:hypothetical protein